MNFWNSAPFIRILFPFVFGIICSVQFAIPLNIVFSIVFILALLVSVIVLFPKLKISFKYNWLLGAAVFILLFLLGYQLTAIKTEINSAEHFSKCMQPNTYALCKIIEAPQEKEKSIKTIVEINAINKQNNFFPTKGKAILYIKQLPNSKMLKYGDIIIVKAKFQEIQPVHNPGQFNYKRYLSFHNIYHQQYVSESDWIHTGNNKGNKIRSYSLTVRDNLLNIFKMHNIKGDEYAVCAALLLGYEDKLNADIMSAYANSGALHVLSVSGMHVALIYVAIGWLLFFFDKMKNGLLIKSIIIICFLWFYAVLTGLSPSVLRAATMFTFIIVAKSFNYKTNIYNTLAVSAFFLLLINPFIIMEVGFQLSYLAVIGIVFLQPKIYNLFIAENKIINAIWSISSVSLAAQIATFPLGLHYFHQFPNYFLFSNLFVIPLSTVVIYLGIILFALSSFQPVADFIAFIFQKLVWLLNYIVKAIDNIPYALIEGITISVLETWLIYGAMISFIFYLLNKKIQLLLFSLGIFAVLLVFQVVEQYEQAHQKSIIVYDIPNTSAIDFISGTSNVFISDTAFNNNKDMQLFYVKHNWWDKGIENTVKVNGNFLNSFVVVKNNNIAFAKEKIKIISSAADLVSCNKKIEVDYLIMSKDANLSIAKVVECYSFKKIIFDSSNKKKNIDKWIAECEKNNIEYHSVMHSGAFILDFN